MIRDIYSAIGESVLAAESAKKPGYCGIVPAIGKGFTLTSPTTGTGREIWKRPTRPLNYGHRLILVGGRQRNPRGLLGRHILPWDRPISNSD